MNASTSRGRSDQSVELPPEQSAASRALMERALVHLRTPAELARRLEVTPGHVSRLCTGTAGLSAKSCFRIADVLDEDPIVILRACGFGWLSDAIDLLCRRRLPPPRARLHDALDQLPRNDRQLVGHIIDRLLSDVTNERPQTDARAIDAPKGGGR